MTARAASNSMLGAAWVAGMLLLAVSQAARGAQVQAFASVEAGSAGICIEAPVFLPSNPFSGVYGVPAQGSTFNSCGFDGGSGASTKTAASGPVTANWSATHSGTQGGFTGSSQAIARYGMVGAAAQGTTTMGGNFMGNAAGAYGLFSDTLTMTSPSHAAGSAGAVQFQFTVDGSISVTNGAFDPNVSMLLGHADALIGVQVNNTSAQAPFNATAVLFGTQTGQVRPAGGFTTGIGSVSGTATVTTAAFPINFGVPYDLTAGLLAEAYAQTESTATGTAAASFLTTAKLTGIEVLDASNHVVSDFSIQSASGTAYGANGVVPEPSIVTCLLLGLAMTFRQPIRRLCARRT